MAALEKAFKPANPNYRFAVECFNVVHFERFWSRRRSKRAAPPTAPN